MNRFYRYVGLPFAMSLMLGSSAALAQAQTQETHRLPEPAHTEQAGDTAPDNGAQRVILDEGLKQKFVAAYSDIIDIQAEYTQKLDGISDRDQAMALQEEAQAEMQRAVVENELTIEEYNQVIQMASTSPDLRAELEAALASDS